MRWPRTKKTRVFAAFALARWSRARKNRVFAACALAGWPHTRKTRRFPGAPLDYFPDSWRGGVLRGQIAKTRRLLVSWPRTRKIRVFADPPLDESPGLTGGGKTRVLFAGSSIRKHRVLAEPLAGAARDTVIVFYSTCCAPRLRNLMFYHTFGQQGPKVANPRDRNRL